MSDFNQEIAAICTACGGKCCRKPFVSNREIEELRRLGYTDFVVEENGLKHIKSEPDCMFLTNRGCSLPVDVRPVDCRIFPLYFASGKDELKLRLHSASRCPYVADIGRNRTWRKGVGDALLPMLSEHWSEAEIDAYARHHRRSRMVRSDARLFLIRRAKGLLNLMLHGSYDRFANPFSRRRSTQS